MSNARWQKTASQNEDGFTLLELLMVVVIIAILVPISQAVLSKQKEEVNMLELKGTIQSVVGSLPGSFPLKEGFNESDLTVNPIGEHTKIKFHRLSVANYCVSVWDSSFTEGVGSLSNPLVFASVTGGCAKVGVAGVPFGQA